MPARLFHMGALESHASLIASDAKATSFRICFAYLHGSLDNKRRLDLKSGALYLRLDVARTC